MPGYPVVRTEFLKDAPSRGLLGLGKKRRDADELPKAGAHEVWVYRVEGRYVVNRGELARDDDNVVRADCVSLVNISRGMPITVEMTIPSAEASNFIMRITFSCTVTDPALVVRENVQASEAILAYLQRDGKLGHLALGLRMAHLNQLRREATARIRAYTEVKPPDVHGLDLRFLGVEVLTPPDLEQFEKRRREAEAEHTLQRQRVGYHQDDELDAERHTQGLEGRRRGGKHAADRVDQEHSHQQARKEQQHIQQVQAEQLAFARREVEYAFESFGGDPLKALIFAQAKGEIDAKELAERMVADERDRVEYTRRQGDLDRDDDRMQISWTHDERTKALSSDRDEQREASNHRRLMELETVRAERQEIRDRRQEDREDRHKQLDMQLDVLRELAKRGHLDMINVQVDKLVTDIYGGTPAVSNPDRGALPEADQPAPIEAEKSASSETGTDDGENDNDPVEIDIESKDEDDDPGR
ncbi:hypothetical protein BJ973_007337 [Actinoplanes tereljensis]|uniref:Band 7 domain-containing protein n=1 Tax=Paractinoplanes tereljensis TaxID=571912 RepID=A0A919NVM4_9ACTN|nr:hypothetical protein [Actinoplanes tereljensis]GIF25080.1 hypothetical protein Ate02nite_78100 [Actinoplanes tereljensis]